MNNQTIGDMRKNVYGVKEIDTKFQRQISELFFQQMKIQTLR